MSLKVEFKKSGITAEWDERFDSILDLAEENGVEIDSECRQGFCGTCKTKRLSGEVHMEETEGLDDEEIGEDWILPCVSIPKTDTVLDA